MDGVTVVIPSIPPRADMLRRAIDSVTAQTIPAEGIAVAMDVLHQGAAATRNRAALMVNTGWTVFLDDDDWLRPWYIEHLCRFAIDQQADIVWGWFDVIGGADPFPSFRGRQYDPECGHVVPITYMARTKLVQTAIKKMGGFQPDIYGAWDLQDQPILNYMVKNLKAKTAASEVSTWVWSHHGANTSGMPDRWT